jgi:hypothetical protein
MDEPDDRQRTGLKVARDGVEAWCTVLIKRFKDATNEALRKMQKERFPREDTRSGRDPGPMTTLSSSMEEVSAKAQL